MNNFKKFKEYLLIKKIIVILRGISVNNFEDYINLLIKYKLNIVEVTLNTPHAHEIIKSLITKYPEIYLGAGTVTESDQVKKLSKLGVRFIVSPNCDEKVIKESLDNNLVPIPGVFTITEVFNAIKYGAKILKLFPADDRGLSLIKNYKAVIPNDISFLPTGGINHENINSYLNIAIGVGLGGSLYKENIKIQDFENNLKKFAQLLHEI